MTLLNQLLRDAVNASFPKISLENNFRFVPMFSYQRGLLSSSAPLAIAKAQRISFEQVAEVLIEYLESNVSLKFYSARGYIVCSQMPFSMFYPHALQCFPLEEVSRKASELVNYEEYCCVVPDGRVPSYVSLRLIARVMCQAVLATSYGRSVRVSLHPLVSEVVETPSDCVALFSRVILSLFEGDGQSRWSRRPFLAHGLQTDATKVVVTSHGYYQLLSAEEREEVNRARKSGACINMPPDGWLISRDRALSSLLDRESLSMTIQAVSSAQKWKEFLFHMASAVPSGDLDPSVALFDECASPLWSLHLLQERFYLYAKSMELPKDISERVSSDQSVCAAESLGAVGFLMSSYVNATIEHGSFDEFATLLEDFIDWGHKVINTPRMRGVKCAYQDFTADDWYLVAGLQQGLSSILLLAEKG
jgi:hypothetical protein